MICPKCKKTLDHVKAYSQGYQKVNIDENGHTENWSSPDMFGDADFECPHCCEDITNLIKPT